MLVGGVHNILAGKGQLSKLSPESAMARPRAGGLQPTGAHWVTDRTLLVRYLPACSH